MKIFVLSLSLFFVFISSGFCQHLDELDGDQEYMGSTFSPTHHIELMDDSKFVCEILSIDSTQIIISTASVPKMVIDKTKVKSIDKLGKNSIKNGKYWFPNPNATRYFFAPSAFTLKKGEGYYQNSYLVINSFNVGITDHITIGGGFEIFSFLDFGGPISMPSFFITPKIGYKVAENVNVAGGVLFANMNNGGRFEERNRKNMGIAYGVGTYGNEDQNFTIGTGWGFIDGELSKKPVFTISGMSRLFRRFAIVTENWIIPTDDGYGGLMSYGVRFFGQKMSVDIGILNPIEKDPFFKWLPYADFVIKF